MKHLFHLVTLLFIIYELSCIFSPIKSFDRSKKRKKWIENRNKNKLTKKDRKYLPDYFWALTMLLWSFVGLMSFNWVIFLLFLIIEFAIITPLKKIFRFNMAHAVIFFLDSILGFVFGVFVLVNSYHLKIDLYSLLMNWIY